MSKRAIILAGGQGVRLRPYTLEMPKPMMPLEDRPILEIIVQQLVRDGFSHMTLCVNHQAEVIQQYFQDGRNWGVRIDYSLEREALGTLGPVLQVRDLPNRFLVMNADVLTDLSFSGFWDKHVAEGNTLTVGVCQRKYESDYGVVRMDERGKMTGFEEKPIRTELVNMGIYMVSREALARMETGKRLGFDALFRKLLDSGKSPRVHQHPGYWLDIGSPADYKQARETFMTHKALFLTNIR